MIPCTCAPKRITPTNTPPLTAHHSPPCPIPFRCRPPRTGAAMSALSPQTLDLLRQYDTPTICNVVELFDLYPRTAGYMDGRIQSCYPKLPPMVGYAATATFRSAAPPRSGNVYAGLSEQVASFAELPGPPIAVFQDLDSPVAAATL